LIRVVFLNRFFFPDHSATSQLATDLAVHLAAHGFEVVAITSQQRYDDPGANLGRMQQHAGISILRVRTTRFGRRNLIGRAIDYLSFYLGATALAFRLAGRRTVFIAMTDPPLLGVPAVLVARMRGAYCVNWLQDIFPEVAERLGVLRVPAIGSALRAIRDWSLRHADVCVVIGSQMAANVARSCRAPPLLIPNWALEESDQRPDAAASEDSQPNGLRCEWGLESDFVVGYSGNMGRAHRLDELVDSAEALRSQAGIRFLLIGDGAQRSSLETRVQSLGLTNVMFKPYQPRELLRQSLTLPDIHVASLDERLEGLIVPSKFVGIIAMGRPVLWIGKIDGEIGALVSKYGCGVVVTPGDTSRMTRVLVELRDDFAHGGARLREMAERATALWRERFKRQISLDAWASAIERCATRRR
jgi:colanic acid biosynthesis glycosyl transferase WcaI